MRPLWNAEIRQRADLLALGEAVLRFDVPVKGGHAQNVRVVSITGSESLAETAVKVATTVKLPPMPTGVAAVLNGKPFRVEYSFDIRTEHL